MEKICIKCNKNEALNKGYCKECFKKYHAEWYQKNKEKLKPLYSKYSKDYRILNQDKIKDYSLGITKDKTLLILIILFGIVAFMSGIMLSDFIKSLKEDNNLLKIDNSNCSSSDLFMSSKCLNQQFKEFFHYNISQTGKKINITQLKTEGGVCSHASEWYKESAESLGFYSSTCKFKVSENDTNIRLHVIAIVSNKDGYCIEDQDDVHCLNFDRSNDEN